MKLTSLLLIALLAAAVAPGCKQHIPESADGEPIARQPRAKVDWLPIVQKAQADKPTRKGTAAQIEAGMALSDAIAVAGAPDEVWTNPEITKGVTGFVSYYDVDGKDFTASIDSSAQVEKVKVFRAGDHNSASKPAPNKIKIGMTYDEMVEAGGRPEVGPTFYDQGDHEVKRMYVYEGSQNHRTDVIMQSGVVKSIRVY